MFRASSILELTLTLIALGACGSTGPADRDPGVCPQTGEFSNHGCARFAAILTTSSGAPAVGLQLAATPLDSATAGRPNGLTSSRSDAQGRVGLQLTWYELPPKIDTLRMRVVARVIDGGVGVPPHPLDSLEVRMVFVGVGQRPPLDTLRWRLPL